MAEGVILPPQPLPRDFVTPEGIFIGQAFQLATEAWERVCKAHAVPAARPANVLSFPGGPRAET